MKIQFKCFDGRYTREFEAEVFLRKTYKGVDIYEGTDGWYYIKNKDTYEYFGTFREAQQYIRYTYK